MWMVVLALVAAAPELHDGPEVLRQVCARCHWGPNGGDEGGFSDVLDREALISGDYLVPGQPKQSELVSKVEAGEMPPNEALTRVPVAQRRAYRARLATLLRAWVQAGAPLDPPEKVRWVGPAELDRRALDDALSLSFDARADARYFSLAEAARAGASREELELLRAALAKSLASLTWRPSLPKLEPVGDDGALYRVSLDQLGWPREAWESTLLDAYPFGVRRTTVDAVRLAEATRSRAPIVRADFLVAEGTRPALYHALLRLPPTAQALESLLGVDSGFDLRDGRVLRAGFNGSGVSQNNRLLERHDARYGAYWRSYDFASSTQDENLFAHPLGPCDERASCPRSPFRPAGGEYIFTLPNGMLGFYLSDGAGRRLERAPTAIVRDPKRPDGAVENGQSCLGCHARGFFFKADQVRPALQHSRLLTYGERAEVDRLCAEPRRLQAQIDADNTGVLRALGALHVSLDGPEPVTSVAESYRGELNLARAAAELGLYPDELKAELERGGSRFASLSALATAGGSVKRDAFAASFGDLVRQLRLGEPFFSRPTNAAAAATVCGQSGTVEERVEDCALVFSAPRGHGETEARRSGFSLVAHNASGQEVWRDETRGVLFAAFKGAFDQQSALDACVYRAAESPETARLGGRWSLPLAGELERALESGLPVHDDYFWSQDVDESHKVRTEGVLASSHGRRSASRDERFAALCVQR